MKISYIIPQFTIQISGMKPTKRPPDFYAFHNYNEKDFKTISLDIENLATDKILEEKETRLIPDEPCADNVRVVTPKSKANWKKRFAIVGIIIVIFCFFLLLLNMNQGFQTAVKCGGCVAAAYSTGQLAKINATEDAILWVAKWACSTFSTEPYAVCDGIAEQFRGEFFYVFRRLADDPGRICASAIPECADANDPLGAGWMIDLPPPPKFPFPKLLPKTSTPSTLRVLQLTDIHVDFEYAEGSEAACQASVCCHRDKNASANLNITTPAGHWGSISKCDIPYRTLESMLRHINETEELDYIMVSGDLINHFDWEYSWEGHVGILRNLSSLFKSHFPSTPIFWGVGNHEGVPVNSFPPHTIDQDFSPSQSYEELTAMNEPWLKEKEERESSRLRGSWSTTVTKGLRLISLNTGFCIDTNFFLYLNQSDPDGTMSWFVQELYQAELAGDFVHVLAHIPPGYSDCLEGWSRNYYRVVQRFSSVIRAQFFGHVHWDYFTVFYEDMHNVESEPVSVGYISPSATTFDYLNPAYRIYTVDRNDDFGILDFETFSTDLSVTSREREPEWKKLYSARDEFNLTNLSPASWNSVIKDIHSNEEVAKRFIELSFRTANPRCDADCRRSIMCFLRSGHHNDTLYCPS
ncbi:hypothetical protein PRIPAC_86732 [Pristionchus pacificus]|uniref:Sphingomyelin phosphodiesterase n=1 Tax=Pristionchus pacificus TaxID=54126 RepID=A0A2A6BTP8_PRIPA|nr:hypothetical protein PRIPAC_86732 [Pristionchus pacificus]|eukprot:PDM69309.1 Calcineurin-like phosphoesterase [Pristionchus pacificus]